MISKAQAATKVTCLQAVKKIAFFSWAFALLNKAALQYLPRCQGNVIFL
jgi:hypothetical protein